MRGRHLAATCAEPVYISRNLVAPACLACAGRTGVRFCCQWRRRVHGARRSVGLDDAANPVRGLLVLGFTLHVRPQGVPQRRPCCGQQRGGAEPAVWAWTLLQRSHIKRRARPSVAPRHTGWVWEG